MINVKKRLRVNTVRSDWQVFRFSTALGGSGKPIRISEAVVSSFSSGLAYSDAFRRRGTGLRPLLRQIWDLDGRPQGLADSLVPTTGCRIIRYAQGSEADGFCLPLSRWATYPDPPPNQGAGRKSVPGHPNLYVVSNRKNAEGEPIGALGDGEASWHTDMSYQERPPFASMLWSIELPSTGGDTWFASMPAALRSLPAELAARVRRMSIKHDGTYDSGGNLRKGMVANDDPSKSVGR